MVAPRKKWAVQPPQMSIHRSHHRSKADAYRTTQTWADEYRAGTLNARITEVQVWVDEGHGWELYETLNLADLVEMKEGA